MRVIYDIQVRTFLKNFQKSLKNYPISRWRREQKVRNLKRFLQSIDDVGIYPICNSKVLGQVFDITGDVLLPELKETKYKDESGFQWRISLFQESKKIIRIYRIIGKNKVTEQNTNSLNSNSLYEAIMSDVKAVILKYLIKK